MMWWNEAIILSTNVGPAMTTKILTENEQMLHRKIYSPLTPDELFDKNGSDAEEQFMARVHEVRSPESYQESWRIEG